MTEPLELNDMTGLPQRLDLLIRHLHRIWCEDDPCPWLFSHSETEPKDAAWLLCNALWEMAGDGTAESKAALARLSAWVERANADEWVAARMGRDL